MGSKGICWKRAKVAEETVSGIIENVKDTIVNDIILGDSRSRGEVFGRGALAVGEIVFGSKGIAQGIKGTGAAKNAVSAVDMMGDAADAVGDTAKGVKILGKIEDAEDIADTAGDVAESARKAEKVIDGVESGLNSNLLDELANSGVKYNPEDIVAITKTADGKLVWLENGTDTAGLNHIITEHVDDFLNKGITQEQIPDYVMNALENGKIVGYQGRGTGRPIYEFTYNGEIHKVAITVGNNGFIVGANPK